MGITEDIANGTTHTINAAKYVKGIKTPHPLVSSETAVALKNRTIQIELIELDPQKEATASKRMLNYIFKNSPDELAISSPSRTGTTQTKGGVWVEDFGIGVKEMNIRGTTGFRKMVVGRGKDRVEKDGRELIMDLSNMYNEYNKQRKDLYTANKDFRGVVMVFHMFADNFHEVVHPTSLVIKRSKTSPLIYQYEMSFIILGAYSSFNSSYKDPVMAVLNTPASRLTQIATNISNYADELYLECGSFTNIPAVRDLSSLIDTTFGVTATANNIGKTVNDWSSEFQKSEFMVATSNVIAQCNKTTDWCVTQGKDAYDLIHSIRKMENCLKTGQAIWNVTKPIESDWENIINNQEDSGCATTLRI